MACSLAGVFGRALTEADASSVEKRRAAPPPPRAADAISDTVDDNRATEPGAWVRAVSIEGRGGGRDTDRVCILETTLEISPEKLRAWAACARGGWRMGLRSTGHEGGRFWVVCAV